MPGLSAARESPLPGGWVGMAGASTPGARTGESWDTSALGMGKGGARCARRWLVLMLAPVQQKSLPLPVCSPRWSAAAPFPPQHVCLPLALIPRALSPPPLSPAHPPVHHTARLPAPQRPRPASPPHKCPRIHPRLFHRCSVLPSAAPCKDLCPTQGARPTTSPTQV